MTTKSPVSFLLSHRTPQVLAGIFIIFTCVSIPLTIASLGAFRHSRPLLRTILMNFFHNISLACAFVELVSGIRVTFKRYMIDVGFHFLQRRGAALWAAMLGLYIYIVTNLGLRVHRSRYAAGIAALVFGCLQLATVLLGLVIRVAKLLLDEDEGELRLPKEPLPPGATSYGSASGSRGLLVQVDPSGVDDTEERRGLL